MEFYTPQIIRYKLFDAQDTVYRDFQAKLMPTIDKEVIIGVRMPILRKLSKEIYKSESYAVFMSSLPHLYYEENNVHAVLIENIKDFDSCIAALDTFLPYVDNWATCDLLNPKVLGKDLKKLEPHIDRWLMSDHIYTVRFGIKMLMTHFLDENFSVSYPKKVAAVKSDEYYVKMMVAWYFATALAKQYEKTRPFLEEKRLDKWTHNKTIQKAKESFRITKEQKNHLEKFRI